MFRFMTRILILCFTLTLLPAVSRAVPEGIILTWPGGGEGTVHFDGTIHAKKGYRCDVCHTAGLFQTKKGVDKMTMTAMKQGKFCGVCHNGTKAFSVSDKASCRRCHQKK